MKRDSLVCKRLSSQGLDYYFTPQKAIEIILEIEDLIGTCWDPGSGSGNIAKIIPRCLASDLSKEKFIYGDKGIDFLKSNKTVDNIISNPPYYCAQEFIEHALKLSKRKVIMFLRILFLESKSRYELFTKHPLKSVYIFSKRIRMETPSGTTRAKVGYAWYIWDHQFSGIPTIHWIKGED